MSLTAADIAEILRLVEDSTFDELSLEFDGLKLAFKRGANGVDGASATERPVALPSPPAIPPAPAKPAAATVAADPDLQDVRSPMLGTFYRAPKPGAPPYVTVGAAVEIGTIVCIIEVMKLMNTVRAEVRGTVAEIPVADGALVEYGEILLRVRKSD
jgi:acetyl-CoA carboxylase biotin carboxyl carrier protein